MITHEEYAKAIKIVIEYKSQLHAHYQDVFWEIEKISTFFDVTKESRLVDCELSIRLHNVLRHSLDSLFPKRKWEEWQQITVNELSGVSMNKFLSIRRVGKSTLAELKELCFYAGVNLKP